MVTPMLYRITHRPTMASTDVAWIALDGTRLTVNSYDEALEYVETQMVPRPHIWPGNIAIEASPLRGNTGWRRVDAWSASSATEPSRLRRLTNA